MKIQLNRAHYPVTVLGYGRRVGLWVQGCSIGCSGCIAHDTWTADPSRLIEVDDVLGWVHGLPAGEVDGVTISGGEPFDQPAALLALVTGLRAWAAGERDLLCYSGRSLAALRGEFGAILDLLDAVIPGPYIGAQAPGPVWRGSANQQLVPLTPLGHRRYDTDVDRPAGRTRLQVAVDGSRVWYIGVPQPGDLAALGGALGRRGLLEQDPSWHS